jgi:DNA-binding FadR family transcriptional regulator
VTRARILIEPVLCREAAINATGAHIDDMNRCLQAQREAKTWRQYENADNRFHRIIAEASGNVVLLALFDQLNAIRRTVVWGRLRDESSSPPVNHHSFNQHDDIALAIRERDQETAAEAMWLHLKQVGERLTSHHTGRKMSASKYTK